MITCLIGTPGSGKSLNMARMIYWRLKPGKKYYVITNVPLNMSKILESERERYRYVSNEELKNAKILIDIAEEYWSKHSYTNHMDYETRIQLFIDECQILFNARDWQTNSKAYWPIFFSVHRHYGYNVILVTQQLGSLDKQVRGVVEYYVVHRKVANFGLAGWIISRLFLGGLFVAVTMWAPLKEKVNSEFFLFRKRFGELYNTHALFYTDGRVNSRGIGTKETDMQEDISSIVEYSVNWMRDIWDC